MDIRDTISRVLLGIAFGFVMGIVMYQATGMDAGVVDRSILRAQNAELSSIANPSMFYKVDCLQISDSKGGTCVVVPESELGTIYASLADCDAARAATCINSSRSVGCVAPNISCGSQGLCCLSTTHYCQTSPEVKCMPLSSSASAFSSSNGLCCNTSDPDPTKAFCQPIQ